MFGKLKRLLPGAPAAAQAKAEAAADIQAQAEGNLLAQQGLYAEAEPHYRRALSHNPGDAKTLGALGFVLKEQGRWAEALDCLRQALALDGKSPLAADNHYLCGLIAQSLEDMVHAQEHLRAALALKPDFALASRDLCRVLVLAGERDAAQQVLSQGMALHPGFGDFHFYQGNFHSENNAPALAVQSYQQALALGAVYADVYCGLARACYKLGDAALATKSFELAQQLDPSTAMWARYESGFHHFRFGNPAAAVDELEQALTLAPGLLKAHSTLLLCLNLLPELSERKSASLQRFAAVVAAGAGTLPGPPGGAGRAAGQPLRIGFVSADFRRHPVGFFLDGVLGEVDRNRFSLHAYSNNAGDDEMSVRLRRHFGQWQDIRDMGDEAVAGLIRRDGIDILVDLGGHTSDNRLAVFAWRPAPVQLSWLGYFATTGLADMDYILVDDHGVPADSTEFFSERIWRLPDSRLCLTPPVTHRPLPVSPLPALRSGHVVFGSYQVRAKITQPVMALWARVLSAVPGAHLRLQISALENDALRAEFLVQLQAAGVDVRRVSLHPGTSWEDYLASHSQVDMLLDTFPYTGGTTTAEALWMGVPTLTLMGNTLLARQGAGMLRCVGLDDWIADSEDAYVAKAVAFARDLPALARLRAGLRDTAARSPLFDARRFAHHLQAAFESMHARRRG